MCYAQSSGTVQMLRGLNSISWPRSVSSPYLRFYCLCGLGPSLHSLSMYVDWNKTDISYLKISQVFLHTPSNWRLYSTTGLNATVEWINLARQSDRAWLPVKMLTQQFCSARTVNYQNYVSSLTFFFFWCGTKFIYKFCKIKTKLMEEWMSGCWNYNASEALVLHW